MIEQYPIAATPKYNFPRSTTDATLPRQFIELSISSLKHAPAHTFQLAHSTGQQFNNADMYEATLRLRHQPLLLKPSHEENVVSAVDTSTMKIGETSLGVVIAVRGANVWREHKLFRYVRFGPFIFHVTEENKRQVFETLERTYFNPLNEPNRQGAPTLFQMPTRIASLLERWLQKMMAKTVNNGLILFDGSLNAGTADAPTHRLKEILETARRGHNIVLAFSKMTNLKIDGHFLTDFQPDCRAPYLLEAEGQRLKPPMVSLGDIYVARLTKGELAFRLDIDKEAPSGQQIGAVERLLGNDLFSESYPETLRLAHILCTFTANEVLAMQRFVMRRFGVEIINRPDMHRILFGLYGKGERNS